MVLFIIFNLGRQISNALEAGKRLDQAEAAFNTAKNTNDQLKQKMTQVAQPGFIEEIARNKLGLARPGETIVIIPEQAISQVLGVQKQVSEVKLPNWQAWLRLIFP